jgi:hypothetical protein
MHLISFSASPRQISKLRNGHKVRIKKGTGFNLVVNPQNYHLVSRAFTKNKGLDIQLSPDELKVNSEMSPEQHDELAEAMEGASPSMEGSGLFKKVPYSEGGALFKFLGSKKAKAVRRALKPAGRAFKNYAQDELHNQLAQAHMAGADYVPDNPNAQMGYNLMAQAGHNAIGYNRPVYGQAPPQQYHTMPYGARGYGLGAGLSGYDALRASNMATAEANHRLAKYHNETVHGQIAQPTIRRYWDEPLEPPSRGSGIIQMQGRGTLLSGHLPVALQSQPFGANFHMQFFLPPEYRKFNDGTNMEGRGLYI